jgi:xylulokinase
MNTYIGIDLGTSAVKLLLVAEDGKILATHTESYPISYPQPHWSEQNPDDWFAAVLSGVPRLLFGHAPHEVRGIGIGGQMHGLVILDEDDNVIRPAILWNDGRTEKQTAYLNEEIGKEKLSSYTANIAFAGFTAPKILWVKENEPKNFARISKIMLPKDYLSFRMTGVHATDYSDASGMLLLDVKNKHWSKEMCDICSVRREQLPKLFESYEKIGVLKKELVKLWGMNEDVCVVAGAGDNAAAAIGTGTVANGDCNISLGTSGTVFISQDHFSVDEQNALHSFAHANGKYHLMGCILSAASCNAWWMDVLQTKDFNAEQANTEQYLGKNDVFFLPYLMGERSPHNDVNAKGAFIGLRPTTTRAQLTLAVMEGVAFALRDCIEIARQNGLKVDKTKICGGGARSPLWRKVIADACNVTVEIPSVEEGPSYGGALLAMVGSGAYKDVTSAVNATVRTVETIEPNREIATLYDQKYEVFKKFYPALKEIYKTF